MKSKHENETSQNPVVQKDNYPVTHIRATTKMNEADDMPELITESVS